MKTVIMCFMLCVMCFSWLAVKVGIKGTGLLHCYS